MYLNGTLMNLSQNGRHITHFKIFYCKKLFSLKKWTGMALIHDEASYTDVTIYTLQHSRALDVATGYKSFGVLS